MAFLDWPSQDPLLVRHKSADSTNDSLGFLFVPMTTAGYIGVSAEKTNSAAGLMNFMRNMGQSIGTSAVTVLIAPLSFINRSSMSTLVG
jgi:hypothetical protein